MRLTLLILLCSAAVSFSQDFTLGAREAAMGNASVAATHAWSFQHNSAALSFAEQAYLGLSVENRFSIQELSIGGAEFVQPTNSGVFALQLMHYGDELLSESQLGLAYARPFGKTFSAGMKLQYRDTRLGGEYGTRNAFLINLGLLTSLSKTLAVGVHLSNPNRTILSSDYKERYPTIFRMGVAYRVSDKVLLLSEGEKKTQGALVGKLGFEYQIRQLFYLRTGIVTKPIQNSLGFGFCWNTFCLDVSTMRHWSLGYVSQCSMRFQLAK